MVTYPLCRMNLYSLPSGCCVSHRWNKQAVLSDSSGLLSCCLFHLKFYFPLFSPGYPSRHLPNYIFSLRLFRYQQNTFLLWEEPITLSLGLKTSVCSHPLYRNYCSIFHLFFFSPKASLCVPLTFKKVFYNQLSSVILNMNLKGQHEEWNRNGWFSFLRTTNKNA